MPATRTARTSGIILSMKKAKSAPALDQLVAPLGRDLFEFESALAQDAGVEFPVSLSQAGHDVEHVGTGIAQAVDGDARRAQVADEAVGFL